MGRIYEEITDQIRDWIAEQHLLFVATAPNDPDGHVNLSPKGARETFVILGPTTVAYVDLIGSGIETVSHLRENGRITLMFCAFEGPPKVYRFHGRGEVVEPGDVGFDELLEHFSLSDSVRPIVRSIVRVEISRVSDSCGFVVPKMAFVEERDQLPKWGEAKQARFGDGWQVEYIAANNRQSIDGLPGIDPGDQVSEQAASQLSSVGKAL